MGSSQSGEFTPFMGPPGSFMRTVSQGPQPGSNSGLHKMRRKSVHPLEHVSQLESSSPDGILCSIQCGCFASWLLMVLKLIKLRMSEAGQALKSKSHREIE